MDAFYTDHYTLPLPEGHRFPSTKYGLLRQAVQSLPNLNLKEARAATDTELLLAHDPLYVQRVIHGTLSAAEQREIGFPWSPAMLERSRRSVGATLAACESALRDGIGLNMAGGTHHAYRDKGSGYCVFNDIVIAARVLQRQHTRGYQVAVIDLDVHQGNGTASILKNDSSIYTLSLHGEKNFPFRKEPSDLDIGLPDGCGDTEYLEALTHALYIVESTFNFDFIIYLAGADPHEGDRLGRLKLTKAGMLARDQQVFDFAQKHHVPIAVTMAGGYGVDINTTVEVQAQTIMAALAAEVKRQQ